MSLWDYLGNVQTAFGKDVKNPNVPTKNDRVPFGPTLDIAKNLEEPTKSAFGVAKNRPVASGIGTRFAPSGSESKITNQNLEEFRKDAINVAASVLGFVGKIGGAVYKASPLGQLDKATGGKITTVGQKALLAGQQNVRSNYAFVRAAGEDNLGASIFSALNILVGGTLGAIAGGAAGFAAGGLGAIPGAIGGFTIGAGLAGGATRRAAESGALSGIKKDFADDAVLAQSIAGQERYNFGRDTTRKIAQITGFKSLGDTDMGLGAIVSGGFNFAFEMGFDPGLKTASVGGKLAKSKILGDGVMPKTQGLVADFIGKKTGLKADQISDAAEDRIELIKKTAAGEQTQLSEFFKFAKNNDAATVANHPSLKGTGATADAAALIAGKSDEEIGLLMRIGYRDPSALEELNSLPQYADTAAQYSRYDSALRALNDDGMIFFKHDNKTMMLGKKYQDGAEAIQAEMDAIRAKSNFLDRAASLNGWLETDKGPSPMPWIERMRADKAIRTTSVKLSGGKLAKGVSESELITGIKQDSLYGKTVVSLYKAAPFSAIMHVVSRAVDDVPHATINFNESIKATTSMRTSLRAAVQKNIIDESEALDIMNKFITAVDEGEKYNILEKYNQTVIRNVAIKYGHAGSSEMVDLVVDKYIKNHKLTKKEATLAQIKNQAYMVGKDGEPIMDPVFISQLANGGFLPDIATIDKAFKEFSLNAIPAWKRAGRLTAYSTKTVVDEMQSLWRNGTLARGGFPINIMRDVNARALGDMALFPMYAQLTDRTLQAISNGVNTVKNVELYNKDVIFRKRNLKNINEEIDNHDKFVKMYKARLEAEGFYKKNKPKELGPELERVVQKYDELSATLAELRRQRQAIIDKTPTRVIQKGKKTIAGWDMPLALGDDTLAQISRSQLNGKEGYRAALASMRDLEIKNLRRGNKGADVIFAAEKPKEHLSSWVSVLNDQLASDPLAIKIMEGKMDRYDLMNWIREDKQRKYIDRFGAVIVAKGEKPRRLRQSDAEYIIDRVQYAVDSIASHPDIQKTLLSGKVTAVQLEKLYPKIEERPPVAGDVISAALGTSNPIRKALDIQKDIVAWLAVTPTAKLNYNHYFAAKYYERLENLIITANERGILPTAENKLQYEKIARSYAIEEYRNKINAFSKDMNFAGLMNYTLAFFPAVVEQFRAYGRIALDNPEFPIRLAYAASIPDALADVQKDAYGNSYVEFEMPYTGLKARLNTSWFNVVNPTAGSILSPGPAATTIAKIINKQNDFAETQLGNFFMPFGSDGNILTAYTPNVWKKFVELSKVYFNQNTAQFQKDKEMLLKQYLFEYAADNNGNMPNNSKWNQYDAMATKKAQFISILRLGNAVLSPTQPKIVTAISYYQDRFNEALAKDAVNGGKEFIDKYPEYFMLADKLTNNVSGIFSDKTAVTLVKNHPNVLLQMATSVGNNFTALGAVFNDDNYAFSATADNYLKTTSIPGFPEQKFKDTQNARESMRSTIVNQGWNNWFKLIEVVSTEMQKPEFNLDPARGFGASVLDNYKKAFIEQQKLANPMWYEEKMSQSGGGDNGKQAAVVKAITIAANTPAMWKDLSQQPRWYTIVEYMNFRYDVKSELERRGVSYSARAAQDVKEMVNQKVWELKKKDVKFAQFYERYFGSDDFSYTFDYAPPSGR